MTRYVHSESPGADAHARPTSSLSQRRSNRRKCAASCDRMKSACCCVPMITIAISATGHDQKVSVAASVTAMTLHVKSTLAAARPFAIRVRGASSSADSSRLAFSFAFMSCLSSCIPHSRSAIALPRWHASRSEDPHCENGRGFAPEAEVPARQNGGDWEVGALSCIRSSGCLPAKAGVACQHDRTRAVVDFELGEDAGDVIAHRLLAQIEVRRDLSVVTALRE